MTIPATHIQALAANLNNLADTIDKIAQSLGDQPAPTPAPKKSSPKKKSVKALAKKSASKKKSTKAKPKKATKMDVVLETIRRARKSIDTATLLKRTGFDKRTISNALYTLKKGNKIKSPKKGVYTKA